MFLWTFSNSNLLSYNAFIVIGISAAEKKFVQSVGLVSVLCLALYLVRVAATHTWHFAFVPENLALAWLALIFGWLLVKGVKSGRWSSWSNLALSVLWLFFLPNTWYVLTDFVHVEPTGEINELYDIVMMSSLVITGFALGFASLLMVHRELLRRGARWSHGVVACILLLCSFAIFLGRDLRWSSWDVVTNPTGVILNVSDQVVDPFGHPRGLNVTALFFVLLGTLYLAIWWLLPAAKKRPN